MNRLQQRVATFNLALSDRSGKATFFLPRGESKDLEARSFEVEAARFDVFERLRPMKVAVVKIDVEDFEHGVLRGMQEVISRNRPFIVCEILPREHRNQETKAILDSLGYTPYWITPSGSCVRVSHFDFRRDSSMDFLLSPVTVPGEEIG